MRSALVGRAFGRDAVQGSVYYGSCNGRYWAIARLEGGADGVFKDVRSTDPRRLGSIATTKCKVPYGLLKLWRQADNCIAASSDPSADPDDPQSTVKIPDPNPPASEPPAKPAPRPVGEQRPVPVGGQPPPLSQRADLHRAGQLVQPDAPAGRPLHGPRAPLVRPPSRTSLADCRPRLDASASGAPSCVRPDLGQDLAG